MRTLSLVTTLLLASLTLSACDAASGDERADVALRFEALQPGKTAATSHVEVDEVKLLVRTIKFTPVDEDDPGGDDDAGDDEAEDAAGAEFKTDAVAIVLDLNAAATDVVVGAVPAGVYKRVTFRIHKPDEVEPIPDPDFREGTSGQLRYSAIITGRVEGEPFVLKLRESTQQKVALVPVLDLREGADDVTVALQADVESWFVDEDGAPLDPRDAGDADEIADRLKRSFRALSVRR